MKIRIDFIIKLLVITKSLIYYFHLFIFTVSTYSFISIIVRIELNI